MAKYIDKSALVAEIEKYISNYKGILNKVDKSSDDWVESTLMLESKIDILQHILSFLDSLEVKDVDLEKEFDNYTKDILACDVQFEPFTHLYNCAKHFLELGLKTKENKL